MNNQIKKLILVLMYIKVYIQQGMERYKYKQVTQYEQIKLCEDSYLLRYNCDEVCEQQYKALDLNTVDSCVELVQKGAFENLEYYFTIEDLEQTQQCGYDAYWAFDDYPAYMYYYGRYQCAYYYGYNHREPEEDDQIVAEFEILEQCENEYYLYNICDQDCLNEINSVDFSVFNSCKYLEKYQYYDNKYDLLDWDLQEIGACSSSVYRSQGYDHIRYFYQHRYDCTQKIREGTYQPAEEIEYQKDKLEDCMDDLFYEKECQSYEQCNTIINGFDFSKYDQCYFYNQNYPYIGENANDIYKSFDLIYINRCKYQISLDGELQNTIISKFMNQLQVCTNMISQGLYFREDIETDQLEQCYEECQQKCGIMCQGELKQNFDYNLQGCSRSLYSDQNQQIEEKQIDFELGRQIYMCNYNNIQGDFLTQLTTNHVKCQNKCIEQKVIQKDPRDDFNTYYNDLYSILQLNQQNNDVLEQIEQIKTTQSLNTSNYILAQKLDGCSQKCYQKLECDKDCQTSFYKRFNYQTCSEFYQNQLYNQENQFTNNGYLSTQSAKLYQECIESNQISYQQQQQLLEIQECHEECVEGEIIQQKQSIQNQCENQTCFEEYLVCIEECEYEHCQDLDCLENNFGTPEIRVYMSQTCFGLQEELNQLQYQQYLPLNLRVAAEISSCSEKQYEYNLKQNNLQAQLLFQCTQKCGTDIQDDNDNFNQKKQFVITSFIMLFLMVI